MNRTMEKIQGQRRATVNRVGSEKQQPKQDVKSTKTTRALKALGLVTANIASNC